MRSIGLDLPSVALVDEHAVIVDIYTLAGGGQDNDGNPVPPSKVYYAEDVTVDIQPSSGQERAAKSGTDYESTHRLIMAPTAEPIPAGALVDVKRAAFIDLGAVEALIGKTLTVVFPADWGTHFQLDLKVG